jgi:hypothetical protein
MKIREILKGEYLHLNIQDRSSLDVVFIPYSGGFICAVYNFGVSAGIGQAWDTFYTEEKLMGNGLSEPDAISVAKAFKEYGDWANQVYAKNEVNIFAELARAGFTTRESGALKEGSRASGTLMEKGSLQAEHDGNFEICDDCLTVLDKMENEDIWIESLDKVVCNDCCEKGDYLNLAQIWGQG